MQYSTTPQDDLVLCEGDASEWTVAMTRQTIERILKGDSELKDRGDMVALWMFYAYTCRWQNTLQARATTNYAAEGLGWSEERVRKAKKALVAMGLIEDVRVTDDISGKVYRWFIKVRYLAKRAETTLPVFHSVENATVWDSGRQMLKYSKRKLSDTLKGNSLPKPTKEDFDLFWESYPKKQDKQNALKCWMRHKSLPEIQEHIRILSVWKSSQGWQKDGGQYIPMPSTWLNKCRWEDQLPTNNSHVNGSHPQQSVTTEKDWAAECLPYDENSVVMDLSYLA